MNPKINIINIMPLLLYLTDFLYLLKRDSKPSARNLTFSHVRREGSYLDFMIFQRFITKNVVKILSSIIPYYQVFYNMLNIKLMTLSFEGFF